MANRGITQEEVDKRTQTASERASMTTIMPPPPENFPHFSQNEANGMQNEENAVSGHLAKTPTQEFANFNRQVNANGSEVDKSPKQLSGTGNENRREMETKSSTNAYGNTLRVRPLIEKKSGTKEKKGRRSLFQRYQHCSTKDVDNDNIETDDEDGDEDKHGHGDGDEYGDENGDDDEPSESLCKRILLFGFRGRKNKKFNESEVLEFHKSSASGNILGAESNSRDPAATSHLNDMNSNNVRRVTEKGRWNGCTENPTSENDIPATRESERLSEGPEEMHGGAIKPDPNFNTEVLYSKERGPKIIQVEPVCRNIAIIHKMVKELPEEPKISTLKLIRQRVSSSAGRLNPLRRWSQSGRDNEARMSLRHSEADLGALTRDEFGENAEREVVNDHTNSAEDLENQTNRTTNKSGTRDSAHNIKQTASSGQNSEEMILDANAQGTKELEAQVIRMTNPVDSVRTCFISKSKSVKSVEPIIEDASNETGGENAAPERAQRPQDTWESIISGLEATNLRRKRSVDRLRDEFAGSVDGVINSNETPHLMPDVDFRGSSALSGFLETITASNSIGSNNGVIQSQEASALMSGVADDSIQDDVDFGAPLCRHSSRESSAEEPRDTESEMSVNQHHNTLTMSRATSMNWESGTSVDQQNDRETSTTVAPAPGELQESRILENYISTIAAINENCYLEVQRIRSALKRYDTKMNTIPESDLENDSEASQRSNSDPPSLTDTINTSESSMSVQQQSSRGVSRSNAIRRKRRSMRFEPYNDELMGWERQRPDRDNATVTSRHSSWRRIFGMAGLSKLSDRMRSNN
ncbi:hypothetical protein BCON_0039g00160 [Botryotinia convoluta]|uniref:Uncharacterized protein n=1 Tax=Botryotinia convoluta TaxID=54673 RepID=A0A4Z1IF55_9HELO|nr:hypothetical protein BCON_0039g00160 [Botryotinia convoluta]